MLIDLENSSFGQLQRLLLKELQNQEGQVLTTWLLQICHVTKHLDLQMKMLALCKQWILHQETELMMWQLSQRLLYRQDRVGLKLLLALGIWNVIAMTLKESW